MMQAGWQSILYYSVRLVGIGLLVVYPTLTQKFLTLNSNKLEYKFFNALFSPDFRSENIIEKMRQVDFISDVKILADDKIQDKLRGVFQSLNESLPDAFKDENLMGVKVIFDKEIDTRSISLAKEYLERVIGDNEITFSSTEKYTAIKDNALKNKIHSFQKWGPWAIGGFFFILWAITLSPIRKKFFNRCQILQRYQRKKQISLKTSLVGTLPLYLIALGCIFMFNPSLVFVATLFAFFVCENYLLNAN